MNFNWMSRTPAGTAIDSKPATGLTSSSIASSSTAQASTSAQAPAPAKRTRVAFLGGLASYSHQAALETFDNDTTDFDPKVGFEDIFSAVENSTADFGIVPLENSTNGSVVPALDLFCDRMQQFPSVLICGEKYLDVRHCLLGFNPPPPPAPVASSSASGSSSNTGGTLTSSISAIRLSDVIPIGEEDSPNSTPKPQSRSKPLVSLSHIKRIYSHPQAFGQCEAFLSKYLRGIERIDASSTTKAAEIVSKDVSGTSVAIASKIASQVHKVKILAQDIEDREDNTTRFMIVRRATRAEVSRAIDNKDPESFYWKPPVPKQSLEHGDIPLSFPMSLISGNDSTAGTRTPTQATSSSLKNRATKSMLTFTVDHRSPGALAEALLVFKSRGLNLTSIDSRPSKTIPWNYIFIVEFEGSRFEELESGSEGGKDGQVQGQGQGQGQGQAPVAAALSDLDSLAKEWRWIGSWRDQLRYR